MNKDLLILGFHFYVLYKFADKKYAFSLEVQIKEEQSLK